jgi:hypothetical protein
MRKRVSGGIAIRECECSIRDSNVVPERGHPKMKIGRFDATARVS